MANNSYTSTSSTGGCATQTPCPACGGLSCLCRPRFYTGQRLTEQDLNNLENYLVAKNQLHNRYLNGWGVVCGLEVVCNPCGGNVHVKTGYALSHCGNDIIVCGEDAVDICKLINACTPTPPPDCLTNSQTTADNCTDLTDDWILSICYNEQQAGSKPSLAGSTSTSSAGGCGCNSSNTKTASNTSQTQSAQAPNCQPTLICEGYVYRLAKAPLVKKTDPGAMAAKFLACLTALQQQIPPLPDQQQTTPQLQYQWCCSFKQALRDLMLSEGLYDCLLAEKLALIQCPNPNNTESFAQAWGEVAYELLSVFWEFIQYCLCSALLPPCPKPVTADCVPLAAVTVRRSDCKIIKVCNWGPRKFAVTLPNLSYWLSLLAPFVQSINKGIATLCCNPINFLDRKPVFDNALRTTATDVAGAKAAAQPQSSAAVAGNGSLPPEHQLTSLLYEAITNPERGFNAQALLALNTLGVNNTLTDLESRNPAQFLLFTQVMAPLINSAIPSAAGILANLVASTNVGNNAASAPDTEMAQLKAMVADLTEKVNTLSAGQTKP